MQNYVIIGNGTAAIGCIEGIRSADPDGKITVISAEKSPAYCRPLISYLLEGKTDTRRMVYRPDDFYQSNKCAVLYGREAVSLDAGKKTVLLDDGTTMDYDRLCVASGSSPFVPPMKGLESVNQKFCFLTLEDALSLQAAVNAESRVLIIGAGLIGLKCAEGLHGKVKSVTIADLSDHILSSILDKESAAMVQKHLEKSGITFHLGDTADSFVGNAAYMRSGEKIDFDILVTAVGVRPNAALVQKAGGACGRAIAVDKRMATSLSDIFAAGDCTESLDVSSGTVKVMALMPNAYMQGYCAGKNMAGEESSFENAIPMNAIGFFGMHLMTAGSRSEGSEIYEEKSENTIKKLYVRDGRLTGFILVGDTERAGIYTAMIRSCTPIFSVDFENFKKSPNLFVFGEKYRGKVLGGVV